MKKIMQRTVGVLITILLSVGLLLYLTNLMERKASVEKYKDFFSQKENFDVLFIGTSHVINGVYPMELWKEYGIVSYNFGGHANQMGTNYWVMENALLYTTPKLMVIDCLELERNFKSSPSYELVHLSLDAFPLSMPKIKGIFDLNDDPYVLEKIGDSENPEPRTKMELLWNFSIYHTRWNQLVAGDFSPNYSVEKGGETRIQVTPVAGLEKINSDQKLMESTVAEMYLRKMIESCQQRGIEVLLTYLPFPASEEKQRAANSVYDIAEEYGVSYLNFLDMDTIFYPTDCYDDNSHLNASGAKKVTEYLGNYIVQNYDIPDQRSNPLYANWITDYEQYKQMKDRFLQEEEDIHNFLMLLADKEYESNIEIYDESLYTDPTIQDLLKNLGIEETKVTDRKNTGENTDAKIGISVFDALSQENICQKFF